MGREGSGILNAFHTAVLLARGRVFAVALVLALGRAGGLCRVPGLPAGLSGEREEGDCFALAIALAVVLAVALVVALAVALDVVLGLAFDEGSEGPRGRGLAFAVERKPQARLTRSVW
jgi:hypothetical protein